MTIGGAFGAKFGGVVDIYAVLLSQATSRPVKVVYTREEDFLDGRPGPGLLMTIKTGVRKDGKILARQVFAYWDVGVQGSGSSASTRVKGVYDIPNVDIHGYDVATNKPPMGAYRAPGAPQAIFASEAQLNKIANALGIDPVDLRLRNLREGREIGFKETLRKAAEKADWWNRQKGPNEGWVVAIGEWTNANGPSSAVCSLQEDGSVKVFSGLMDITGTDTAMAQIAAEVVGASYDRVSVTRGDTNSAPMAVASGGSQATFSMGNAVRRAATEVRERVLEIAADLLEARPDDWTYETIRYPSRVHPITRLRSETLLKRQRKGRRDPSRARAALLTSPARRRLPFKSSKSTLIPTRGRFGCVASCNHSIAAGRSIR